MKILVVEDNHTDAQYMCSTLQDRGFRPLVPADSVSKAILSIKEDQPPIVIFDYEIRGGFGSDVVEHFKRRYSDQNQVFPFHYAFLTSHEAEIKEIIFELNHPNFLGVYLKTDFNVAIEQISQKFDHFKETILDNSDLVTFKGLDAKQQTRLVLKNDNECYLVPLSKILYLEGNGGATNIYWQDGTQSKFLKGIAKSLTAYENALADMFFVRVSRKHLVNLAHLTEFDNRNTSYVKLSHTTTVIPVTRGYENELKSAVGLVNV